MNTIESNPQVPHVLPEALESSPLQDLSRQASSRSLQSSRSSYRSTQSEIPTRQETSNRTVELRARIDRPSVSGSASPQEGPSIDQVTSASFRQSVGDVKAAIDGHVDDIITRSVNEAPTESRADVSVTLSEIPGAVQDLYEGHHVDPTGLAPVSRVLVGEVGEALRRASQSAGGSLSPEQRLTTILGSLGSLQSESPGDATKRWGKNIAIDLARTGTIVAATTAVRQYIGAAVEGALGGDSATRTNLVGVLSGLGLVLNAAGALRDEVRGTATNDSRLARATLALYSGAATGVAVAASKGVLPGGELLAPLMTQATSYTLARDLAQVFFPLKNNNASLNTSTVDAAKTAYALNQFAAGMAMDQLPNSGAGAAAKKLSFGEMAGHTMGRAALNGAAEMGDDLVLNGLQRATEARTARQGIEQLKSANSLHDVIESNNAFVKTLWSKAGQHEAEGRENGLSGQDLQSHTQQKLAVDVNKAVEGLKLWVEPRVPNRNEIADQFLTTNAARTSMFNGLYAASMVADGLLGSIPAGRLSSAAQSALTNGLASSILYAMYGSFVDVHRTQSPPERQADAPQPIEMSALRQRRTTEADSLA